ncbi:hypothetical protein ANCDUO_16733 [Ancylostoma duodenale]|uniref:AP180 N-terminal homology (ANTH) domain-containing protein n=1 Tax=Ancylostoma duodenale TaxID=51022 RepID=A0A0C2CA27_9BILA|nr:hypothetical protein ANCDUO_16733 [Ancylostoma duodenale]
MGTRLDKVSEFLRVAESVGIDRGEIPDLTRAPASLLEALEAHLIHLEGGRAPSTGIQGQYPSAQTQLANFSMAGGFQMQPHVGDVERMRYIELEKERLRQFEEQKRQQGATGTTSSAAPSSFNPFAADASSTSEGPKKTNDDLLDLFNVPTQTIQPILLNLIGHITMLTFRNFVWKGLCRGLMCTKHARARCWYLRPPVLTKLVMLKHTHHHWATLVESHILTDQNWLIMLEIVGVCSI